jgi:hypothetical protein
MPENKKDYVDAPQNIWQQHEPGKIQSDKSPRAYVDKLTGAVLDLPKQRVNPVDATKVEPIKPTFKNPA